MTCVTTWGVDAVSITNEQLQNKSVCRSFAYYVDPTSTKTIELGTKAFPFKSINLPFVEILNFYAHSTKTITVNVKEHTNNMMLWKSNYIINMTQVVVQPYSDTDSVTPGYANIYIKDIGVRIISSQTQFNILKNSTLMLDSILNTALLEAQEISNGKLLFFPCFI